MDGRFIDRVVILVRAGKGGDGMVAFRREAMVPKGGPSGGDGGDGGSVFLQVDQKLSTLADFIGGSLFRAEDGRPGGSSDCTGAGGSDLVLRIPPGTQVYDHRTGELLADMTAPGERFLTVRGGTRGRGNSSFATSRNRTPRQATRGRPGEERQIRLELKLMADAGLVGFPNAGKSTLVRTVSSARPKVGDYPFTTLHPSLGVVKTGFGESFVIADLPGLISGAARGIGLGFRFLRHAERNRLLVFVLAPDLEKSPREQLEALQAELLEYGGFQDTRWLAVLSKCDLLLEEELHGVLDTLPEGVLALSSATGKGVEAFLKRLAEMVRELRN